MKKTMEIICIGNELLIGKTLNTNAQWLAKRATGFGISVQRISVVADDAKEIATAVQEAIARESRFIITTGGLGPTFDDKTLEGVAKALNRRLEINEKALKAIKDRYSLYVEEGKIGQFELTPARVKMAKLPRGAEPLPNSVGTAPGVSIETNGTVLLVLPGVPAEMEAIFEESVVPLFKKEGDENTFFETSVHVRGIVESSLAPLIEEVMRDNLYVYIKSHPKRWGEGIEIHFSTTIGDSETARKRLGKAVAHFSELTKGEGGKIKPK